MLENCSASANSKLISGPLSICMKQAHLKPPQENDLIIFNYLEWAQGLEGSRYLGFLLLLGIIVDSGRKRMGKGSGIEFIRQTLFWVLITHSRIRKWNALKVDSRSFKERWDRNFNWQKAFGSLTALAWNEKQPALLKDEQEGRCFWIEVPGEEVDGAKERNAIFRLRYQKWCVEFRDN